MTCGGDAPQDGTIDVRITIPGPSQLRNNVSPEKLNGAKGYFTDNQGI
jgi:hypothetical protein